MHVSSIGEYAMLDSVLKKLLMCGHLLVPKAKRGIRNPEPEENVAAAVSEDVLLTPRPGKATAPSTWQIGFWTSPQRSLSLPTHEKLRILQSSIFRNRWQMHC